MPQLIEVPGQGIVEFPDDMTDEQITAAINGVSKQPSATQAQTRGIGSGIAQGLRDPIDAGAQLLSHAVPEGVRRSINQANNWLADKTGLVGRLPEGGVDYFGIFEPILYAIQSAA